MITFRLNMRHTIPQIGIRNQQSTVDDSHMIPAEVHGNNQQARSNKGATQARIDIDSYQSRHAYGARTMNDFTSERGQRGISDVQSSDSRHTQNAWSNIENAAKRGNYIQQQAKSRIFSEANQRRYLEIRHIPKPQITVSDPSQVVGDSDLGDVSAEITTNPSASIRTTPGSAETYIKDQGFFRAWISENKYDIYA